MSLPLDVHDCPLDGLALIEASAGTGKTWAICGLVLRLLVERELSMDQVLVVTFTNAATAELRERVRARLVEVLDWLAGEAGREDPFIPRFVAAQEARGRDRESLRARLRAALTAFDEASIFTIHGFCQRALGESPFAAAQPFALELGDGSDLVRQVVADFWRLQVAHGELPAPLVDWLTGQGLSPEQLERLLQRALKKPLSTVLWPQLPAALAAPDTGSLEQAFAALAGCWQQERQAVLALLSARLPDLKYFKEEDLAAGARDWDAYLDAGQPLGPLSEKALAFRASVLAEKKTRAGKQPPVHPCFDLADALARARESLETLLEAHRLALFRRFLEWAPAQVAARKRASHRVDFDDLLGNLHQALTGPRGEALAASLRQRYPAALIDEFQDTDPLQFGIFQRIYGGGEQPVFLVGDPKQAIYSFRQADLHTYMAARDQAAAHYHLDANQRSTVGVIAGINALFGANPRAFMLDGLAFQPTRRGEKPLAELADSSTPERAALHFWQLPEADGTLLDKPTALARAAQATAEEIARLLQAGRQGQLRIGSAALQAGRIAVLVRTHKQGRLIRQALAAVGLKAAELAQDNVFQSAEAEDLERFLAALLEPARTGFLKAALGTPLLGQTAEAIAALAEDEAALNGWVERFGRWHRLWQERGIIPALGAAGRELHLSARLLGLPEGERRLTNHLHLLELLHQAEALTPQPVRLLRWFAAQRREPRADEVAQLRLESDRDLVSIVTIHKAKGLEYDLVFCPFLWEGGIKSRSDGLPGHAYHDEDGRLLLDYRPEGEAPGKQAAKLEQAAELLRLYYVALTRPVQRCYLVWGAYGRAVAGGGMSRAESSRGLLNWLVAGAGLSPEDWLGMESRRLPDGPTLAAAWQQLIEDLGASSETLPEPGRYRLDALPAGPDPEVAQARRQLRPDWRIDSFSGLVRGASLGDGSDHDGLLGAEPLPQLQPEVTLPASDVLHFPRGPRAGDCIHHLFEFADFTSPDSCRNAAQAALIQHPPGDPALGELYLAMLEGLAADVLATPLALPGASAPLCLSRLGWERRLVEMEFHLPAARLAPERLQAIMHRYGEAMPQLAFPALQGFLKGFMDLVFAHEGRYYVLDWKSNHLGWQPTDYGPGPMQRAMFEHGYNLQARLYLLALHRFLAFRLPDYDPARHLGGACYLFVRGVRPGWRLEDGSQAGVCLLPPRPELILELETLLADPVRERQALEIAP